MKVSARHSFEIELDLSGTYSPARPASGGSRFEPPINPPEDACVEDVTIEGLGALRLVMTRLSTDPLIPTGLRPVEWKCFSMLEGVDVSSPDIQKLFANLLAFCSEDAEAALMSEVA